MKVAIYSRGLEPDLQTQLLILIKELRKYHIEILLLQTLAAYNLDVDSEGISIFSNSFELDDSVDCLISLGGDGTILDCVTLVRDKNIPILGINFGRLGFLAGIGKDELTVAVDALVNGTYVVDKRTLIHLDSSIPLFGETPFALNEFAIHKRDISPMIKIHTYLNGEFLNTYWCDGVIVATPTGSTGYNMSCNGPIVFPDSSSFVITPVAPHNLSMRPIVVPDSNIISFEIEGRTDQFICAMDARREIVDKDIQLAIKKEKFTISLLRLNENNFLSTLRTKLRWGMDKRNSLSV
ncbi:NAD kinase [Limnovirga soli]|jgi:NAD+ kinase|uniref:NAD kinase n=1 Tax=Limnovirga soli TaxID=2656915 RepID=A0A8J8FGT6_9BACT|nr:NAD kinase [Limnovirga soli]NNV56099.1 NAD kinase [Limnovirga soli]